MEKAIAQSLVKKAEEEIFNFQADKKVISTDTYNKDIDRLLLDMISEELDKNVYSKEDYKIICNECFKQNTLTELEKLINYRTITQSLNEEKYKRKYGVMSYYGHHPSDFI